LASADGSADSVVAGSAGFSSAAVASAALSAGLSSFAAPSSGLFAASLSCRWDKVRTGRASPAQECARHSYRRVNRDRRRGAVPGDLRGRGGDGGVGGRGGVGHGA